MIQCLWLATDRWKYILFRDLNGHLKAIQKPSAEPRRHKHRPWLRHLFWDWPITMKKRCPDRRSRGKTITSLLTQDAYVTSTNIMAAALRRVCGRVTSRYLSVFFLITWSLKGNSSTLVCDALTLRLRMWTQRQRDVLVVLMTLSRQFDLLLDQILCTVYIK